MMSPQETQMLQDFLNQLTQVRGVGKDAQADAMIAAAVAQQPDATYLLVQRALLMDQALTTSKAQIASLQSQIQALQSSPVPPRGFLDSNAWGNAPMASRADATSASAYPSATAPAQIAPQYQAAPAAAPASASAAAPSSGFFGGGMGSMLGTVAATAAGVAGGAFLYQGIEHLMNSGSGSGSTHSNGFSSPTEKVENTTVNNYYGGDADKSSAQARGDGSSGMASSNDLADLSNFDLDGRSDGSSDGGSSDDSFDDSVA